METKATFMLDEKIMNQAKEVVEKGLFQSMNDFVETAIKDELERIEKNEIKRAIIEASKDDLFISDIREIERDFEYTDYKETEI